MLRTILFLGSLASSAFVFALASNSNSVQDCGVNSLFQIQSLSLSPDVPIVGQNSTLHSNYHVVTEVKEGTTKYSCTLNGFPVVNEVADLCTQTACPILAGDHADTSVVAVPDVKGTLVCTIKWLDVLSQELLCIKTRYQLGSALRGGSHLRFVSVPLYYVVPEEEAEAMTMSTYIPPQYRNTSQVSVCEENKNEL